MPDEKEKQPHSYEGDKASDQPGEDDGGAPKEGGDDHLKDDQKPTS